jgi:hypothetical protein
MIVSRLKVSCGVGLGVKRHGGDSTTLEARVSPKQPTKERNDWRAYDLYLAAPGSSKAA